MVFIKTIQKETNAANPIFEESPIPRINKNNGKKAIDGTERKKSIINSKYENTGLYMPNISPKLTPIMPDITKLNKTLVKVEIKSCIPPLIKNNNTSLKVVFMAGRYKSSTILKYLITTQTIISEIKPMAGNNNLPFFMVSCSKRFQD